MSRLTSSLSTVRALGLSAVIAAALAMPAAAQPANAPANALGNAPGTPPAQSEAVPHAPAGGAAHHVPPPPQEMAQQRLNNLRQRLRVTPAEQGAWDRFAQASMQSSARIAAAFRARADQVATMNAVQNMQSFADIETQRAQDMQGLVPAFQQLYAALSPAQQKSADELFREVTQRAHTRATKGHH